MRLADLETPVLTADLDAIERNISRMQAWLGTIVTRSPIWGAGSQRLTST